MFALGKVKGKVHAALAQPLHEGELIVMVMNNDAGIKITHTPIFLMQNYLLSVNYGHEF